MTMSKMKYGELRLGKLGKPLNIAVDCSYKKLKTEGIHLLG